MSERLAPEKTSIPHSAEPPWAREAEAIINRLHRSGKITLTEARALVDVLDRALGVPEEKALRNVG